MLAEIYTEQYKFEWEHRAYLLSAMNLSILLATIAASALITIARLHNFSESVWSFVSAAMLIASCGALCFAGYSIFRAICGYEYALAPKPHDLKRWREDLARWHQQYGSTDSIDDDFSEGFTTKLCDAIEKNRTNNRRRSARVYRANMAASLALALLVFPGVMFVIQDKLDPVPQAIEIVGGKIQIVGGDNDGE